MEWFKLSALLPTDPKWKPLSPRAKVAYIEMACEIAQHETDGIYHAGGRAPRWLDELIEAGLVVTVAEGYEVPAFLKWNKTHDEMEAQREARRRAGALGGSKKASNRQALANDTSVPEVEVEREVEEPTTRSKTADAPTRRPSHDHAYLVSKINERWGEKGGNLSMGAVQKFISRYGFSETDSALRALHGFPPEEPVRSAYAYVDAILKGES